MCIYSHCHRISQFTPDSSHYPLHTSHFTNVITLQKHNSNSHPFILSATVICLYQYMLYNPTLHCILFYLNSTLYFNKIIRNIFNIYLYICHFWYSFILLCEPSCIIFLQPKEHFLVSCCCFCSTILLEKNYSSFLLSENVFIATSSFERYFY